MLLDRKPEQKLLLFCLWPCFVPLSSHSISNNCWLSPFLLMQNISPCSWNGLHLRHITLPSYSVSFLTCTRNRPLPFSGDFTAFFTNQLKTNSHDASTSPLLIHHIINVPWKLYEPQVWSGPSSPLYTNSIIRNFTMYFFQRNILLTMPCLNIS